MCLRKYIFMLILSMVLLQAKEDFSVHVELKDRNITSLSQLMPANAKSYQDTGYYLPIKVSYINNTDTIQHLNIGGTCYGISSWEVKGDLRFIRKKIVCKKRLQGGRKIILQPKESVEETRQLLFPKSYLDKRVRFKIGFKKIIGHSFHNYKHIVTYWSEWIVVNADL